jgi:chorismate mutase
LLFYPQHTAGNVTVEKREITSPATSGVFYLGRNMPTQTLEELRSQIDQVDQVLIEKLQHRLELVKEVGKYKKQHNLPALQPARWHAVLQQRQQYAQQLGVNPKLIEKIWNSLHHEALHLEENV